MPQPVLGAPIAIDWTNEAGSGFNAAEKDVINAAIDWWEMLLDPAPKGPAMFTVTISKAPEPSIGLAFNFNENADDIPQSASIRIDDGANFMFFVDPTPHENEEFNQDPLHVQHFTPKPGSAAVGKVDLLEVAKHELGHALGFSRAYTLFAAAENPANTLTYAPGQTATLVAGVTHLDPTVHPEDLMGNEPLADLLAGDRWVQSKLDLDILSGIYGYGIHPENLHTVPEASTYISIIAISAVSLISLVWRRRRRAV
jgi:hypothetical protein